MLKKTLFLGLLAFNAAANASAQSWDFSYTGFLSHREIQIDSPDDPLPPVDDVFLPAAEIRGSFAGEDLNHDGVLNTSELISFRVNGKEFLGEPQGSNYFNVRDFSYGIDGGALDFHSSVSGSDGESVFWGETIQAGVHASWETSYPRQTYLSILYWTPETKFNIVNTSPVPEPAGYAMLGMGLLGLAGLRRLRRS